MYAVIMAGGKGTRLSAVLQDIPKPMVKIAGKPLLQYQVENLKENGIKDIILVVGYLGDVIRKFFRDGSRFGVRIRYFQEQEPLGTAGALFYLKEQLTDDFMLLFGDLFIDINFGRFYQYHKEKAAEMTLYAHPNSHPHDSDILITDEKKRVVRWSYKNTKREEDYQNLVNAGIYVVSPSVLRQPEVLRQIGEDGRADLEKQVITGLLSHKRVYAYQCTEYVKDVGTPERLGKAEEDCRNGICGKRNLKHKQKCIFLDRDGTVNRHVGFLNKPEQMELEDGAAEAIKCINDSEYLAIVASNQPVAARGECTLEGLEKIHKRMHMLLGAEGAYLDGLYFCPHHPDSGYMGEVKELKITCKCRKPGIGMIRQAEMEYHIDLSQSWIIGDTTVDIRTGKNAGMKTALVQTGEGGKDGKYQVESDFTGKNLYECVQYILESATN